MPQLHRNLYLDRRLPKRATVNAVSLLCWLIAATGAGHAIAAARDRIPSERIESPWTHFAADAASTQYSPLEQITPANVAQLKRVWTYRTGAATTHADTLKISAFSDTPIIAAGSLIVCTPWSRIIALDPATGAERWIFDPQMTLKQPIGKTPAKYVCRGVASWLDPSAAAGSACAVRLIFGTNDHRIFAIDAQTGHRCTDFAHDGEIDVQIAGGEVFPGEVQFTSPPMIVNGVAVFGSFVADNVRSNAPRGTVRAYDARTGAPKWAFEPIPQDPADPAYATWKNASARHTGAANAWPDLSADLTRNMVFVPTGSPSLDLRGATRPGNNRYANSTVALDAATGKVVWDFQIVHHDLWDYDLPAAPLLIDLTVGGKTVPAVVQLTKMGLIFVFDRTTGVPLFPIEERPVKASTIQGEWTSPTQPIPTSMPSLIPHVGPEDAWGFTPLDRWLCSLSMRKLRAHLYDPPTDPPTFEFPSNAGGSNLGMRAYDPKRKLLIANTNRVAARELLSIFGAPCNPPPWGALAAIDLEKQKIVWEVPLGSIEKLAPVPVAITLGTPNRGGPMVTGSGLIFIGATMDDALRAFATTTGKELWKAILPAGGQATPLTYMVDGKQYVVIAAGGHSWMKTTPGDYVVAYALPDSGS